MRNLIITLLLMLLVACNNKKNFNELSNIESPIIASDISSQKITAFAEDGHGHIWIGTFRGLNKYDGNEFHQYFSTDDSLDLPDNQITDILLDSKNRLWIATVNGVCRYTEKDNFHRIPIKQSNQNGQQLIETRDGQILLNFYFSLAIYNPGTDSFDEFKQYDAPYLSMNFYADASNDLWSVNDRTINRYNSKTLELEDSIVTDFSVQTSYLWRNNELWISGDGKVAIFDTRTRRFVHTPQCITEHPLFKLSSVRRIYSINPGTLVIATDNHGLFVYNRGEQTLFHQNESGFPFSGTDDQITTLFVDSQSNLWLGTEDQGFSTRNSYKERFNNDNFLSEYFRNKPVLALAEDNTRNLWLLTKKNGLYIYNLDEKRIQNLDISSLLNSSVSDKKGETVISSMFLDNEGHIWVASWESNWAGQCKLDGSRLTLLKSFQIQGPHVFTQDDDGTIWVSTTSEYVYSLKKGETVFEPLEVFQPFFNFVSGFIKLRNGKIMASPFYHRPKMIEPKSRKVETIDFEENEWKQSIPRSVLITNVLFEDSRGEIWIGTKTNGVLRYYPDRDHLEPVPGAPCMDIVSIEEDVHGNLWVGTEYGLGRYNRDTKSFTNYFASSGIGGNQFIERSSCILSNGTLVFGGTHGLTFFDPIDLPEKRKIPLMFENLKVHNVLIRPQDNDANIAKHLSFKPDIRLRHYQNGFSISYAALDYSKFKRVNYYYKLEGFDKYWVDANNNREAYYANLPAGKYNFSIRIADDDQSIAEAQETIRIIVEPAPWLTWWAWALYILIACSVIIIIFRGLWRIRKEKEAAFLAEREKEHEQRTNQMNMRFFTNVSHEFRTPLTMIAGPISQLYESTEIPQNEKALLGIVKRSVTRMLQLVNQMMDFHMLENDTLKLKVKLRDVTELLSHIIDVFRVNTQSKGVELRVQGLEDRYEMWVDEDKMDKILGNLLSNAIKFTPAGGLIAIDFDIISRREAELLFNLSSDNQATLFAKLTVNDNGKGIPEGNEEKIFERSFKADNNDNSNYYSTGIGLYHARSLAELHHGYLKAENKREGQGAIFTLLLPVNEGCYAKSERIQGTETESKQYQLELGDSFMVENSMNQHDQKTVFVVEDDPELSNYLHAILSPHYNVIRHFDADKAYQQMLEEAPDLVLSDVVMPDKDGYSFCRDIKNNIQLSHIPVVLVTAKTALEDKIKGLDTGADAYITKPFEPSYLLALVNSQLINREKVQLLLSATTKADKIDKNVLSHHDNVFMSELYHLMETELSNSELDILQMTERMKISRSKFYYKVKGLTGENPAAFFRIYKLNRAAELIKEGKFNISEIADMTGFTTLSHFSASFKKQFGESPSKYH